MSFLAEQKSQSLCTNQISVHDDVDTHRHTHVLLPVVSHLFLAGLIISLIRPNPKKAYVLLQALAEFNSIRFLGALQAGHGKEKVHSRGFSFAASRV